MSIECRHKKTVRTQGLESRATVRVEHKYDPDDIETELMHGQPPQEMLEQVNNESKKMMKFTNRLYKLILAKWCLTQSNVKSRVDEFLDEFVSEGGKERLRTKLYIQGVDFTEEGERLNSNNDMTYYDLLISKLNRCTICLLSGESKCTGSCPRVVVSDKCYGIYKSFGSGGRRKKTNKTNKKNKNKKRKTVRYSKHKSNKHTHKR